MAAPEANVDKDESFVRVGSLARIPIPEVIRQIALQEKSGDLQIIYGRIIKTVYFDRGFVVFAASNLKKDRLGESMVVHGRLSNREFTLASMLMKKNRSKFGQALVDGGFMSEEELGRQVALQVNRIVLSLFNMNVGVYSFDERRTIIPVDLMVSLSVYRILLDGIRRMANDDLIKTNLPDLGTTVRVAEEPPFTVDFDKLRPLEKELLRAAGKGATLEAICQAASGERDEALRGCYGLLTAGLLEPGGAGTVPRRLKVQEETGVFVLSEIQRKFARIRAENVKQEILMEFDRLEWASDEDLLKVGYQASPSDIQKAYEERRSEWEEKRNPLQGDRAMMDKVDEIQVRLGKAYRQMMAESQSGEGEAVEVASDDGSEAEASLDSAVEPPPAEPAQPDTPPPMPPMDDELVEEVEIDIDEDLAVPEGASYGDTQPVIPAKSAEKTATKEPDPAARLTTDQKEERIQQILRDVKLHFMVKDWEGAVSLLQELVEISPDNAEHRGMLARTMARHPIMRKDAERHFIEALRLAPQSAEIHYSLGLYYESFKFHSRAKAEYRTALRIDPHHKGARKHLVGERGKKDPVKDVFRKIFG